MKEKIIWPKFTLNSFKASLPIWKTMFSSWFNWMIIAMLVIIIVVGWTIGWDAGAGMTFLSTWLFWHRFIIAEKKLLLKELSEKLMKK